MQIKWVKYISFLLIMLSVNQINATDTTIITQLLHRVRQLQPKSDGVFPKGIFPSYRTYALNKERQKADINIFFTGLIVFTLNNIHADLTASQQRIADSIIDEASPVALKFKNQKGRDTYNFWPTDTPQIFPNAGWMNWFNKSQALPDDLDDTVIMLLALKSTKTTAASIHQLMQQFTNNPKKQVNNTFKKFRNIPAYSTWFGKKMPVDFDVSVLSNVLYFVQYYKLGFTAADTASLQLIEQVIKEKQYLTAANYISPHYSSPIIILYHLSRLMQHNSLPSLEKYKPELIEAAIKLLAQSNNFMETILLHTSLMRWGSNNTTLKSFQAASIKELVEADDFSFFIANMASILPNQLKKVAAKMGVGKFYYHCSAYNNILLLENLVLQNRKQGSVSLQ
jgi:hypothetical protein